MSGYNTRRPGTGAGFAPSPNAVGQRRPPANYNTAQNVQQQQPQQQQSSNVQTRQQATAAPQIVTTYRTQQTPQAQQQQQPQVTQQTVAQQAALKPSQPSQYQPQSQTQSQMQLSQQSVKPVAPKNEMEVDGETTSEGPKKGRPVWMTRGNKISKRERLRRRNIRLSKMLQPKNALMILNELVRNPTYTVADIPFPTDQNLYEATVVVDDVEHKGIGRSKLAAKTSAAEVAIRHLVKYKKIGNEKPDVNGAESMEVTEEDVNVPLPWQHVASFALYKLFCSWGEDPNKTRDELSGRKADNQPAKKLPENAVELNPLMVLNQMQPHTQFEELGKSGHPPNTLFTFRVTVGGENFVGTGSSKKAAKKMAAFAACKKVFGINYPAEVYSPTA